MMAADEDDGEAGVQPPGPAEEPPPADGVDEPVEMDPPPEAGTLEPTVGEDGVDPTDMEEQPDAGVPAMESDPLEPQDPPSLDIDAGPAQSAPQDTSITLSASISGPDGRTVLWSGDGLMFSAADQPTTQVTASAPGTWIAILTVTAGDLMETDQVELTFVAPSVDVSPTVNAGTDRESIAGETVALEGQALDADGVLWTQLSGPEAVVLADPTSSRTTFTAGAPGVYEFALTATRGAVAVEDRVRIEVQAAAAQAPNPLRLLLIGVGDPGDLAVRDLMRLRGHEITVAPPATSASGATTSYDAVLISSSINSSDLDDGWKTIDLPVVTWEAFSYADLGLIAGTPTILGSPSEAAGPYVQILQSQHPLSADLSGRVRLSSRGYTFAAEPGPGAIRLGTVHGSPSGASLGTSFFAYETGAAMPGGTAPARRVALPLGLNLAAALTADGKSLLEAAIRWAVGGTPTHLTRVLPLGDSITRGFGGTVSYRGPLAAALDARGCAYDFVGTLQLVQNNAIPSVFFDWDHEGHGGFTTGQILVELSNYLEGNAPDIALLHLGTNDLLQAVDIATSEENLSDIIEVLRSENPRVVILLAEIIPGSDPRLSTVSQYNEAVRRVASARDSATSPVVLVDQFTGFDTGSLLTGDGIHPTAAGDDRIAERWLQALTPRLSCER